MDDPLNFYFGACAAAYVRGNLAHPTRMADVLRGRSSSRDLNMINCQTRRQVSRHHQCTIWQIPNRLRLELLAHLSAGRYRSPIVPGFWLDVAWLWLDPLPWTDDVLLEFAGDAYARQLVQSLRRRGYLPSDE